MKAVIYSKYGPPDVLRYEEAELPIPAEDEVRIRVRASSLNMRDRYLMRGRPFPARLAFGLFRPRVPILGADVAGVVDMVGAKISLFKPGDEVFGILHRHGGRAFAEYACAGEEEIAPMPRNLSFVQAAAVPLAAMTALQGLRDSGSLKPGMRVLVQGASGGVGGFALQLAKAFGAEVTAVCSSRNLSMAASLGADHVVDYGKEDFTRGGPRYDLVFAANGYHPVSAYLGALRPGGAYVVAGGTMRQLFEAMLGGRKKARVVSLAPRKPDLLLIRDLLEDGKLRPIIDDTYPLPRVAEAFRYFEAAHPKGKVAISVGPGEA